MTKAKASTQNQSTSDTDNSQDEVQEYTIPSHKNKSII